MSEKDFSEERLTDVQIVALLGMTLSTEIGDAFQRLAALPSDELLREVRNGMYKHRLKVPGAASLIGLNDLALKGWVKGAAPLGEDAHAKLAGLCVLLSLPEGSAGAESASLARAAILAAGGDAAPGAPGADESADILAAVFGPAGLSAAALHAGIKSASRRADTPGKE